jgi:hypothetical protein
MQMVIERSLGSQDSLCEMVLELTEKSGRVEGRENVR